MVIAIKDGIFVCLSYLLTIFLGDVKSNGVLYGPDLASGIFTKLKGVNEEELINIIWSKIFPLPAPLRLK